MEVLVKALSDPSIEVQLDAATQIRVLLCSLGNPHARVLTDLGVVPALIALLSPQYPQEIQHEACWALGNIGSAHTEQTQCIVHHGALGKFKEFMFSTNESIRESALLGLANIAADSPAFRDLVIDYDIVPCTLRIIEEGPSLLILRKCLWLLSNCCRESPLPSWGVLSPLIPTLFKMLLHHDEEVVDSAAWGLLCLSEEYSHTLIEMGILPILIGMVCETPNFPLSVLRFIGNVFLNGTDPQIDQLLKSPFLNAFSRFLSLPTKPEIIKESCWIISNINARNAAAIQLVIDADIIHWLVLLYPSTLMEIKLEIIWALCNAIVGGDPQQVRHVLECGALDPLCDVLVQMYLEVLPFVIQTLDKLFQVGEADATSAGTYINRYLEAFGESHGWEKMESTLHINPEIQRAATNLAQRWNQ